MEESDQEKFLLSQASYAAEGLSKSLGSQALRPPAYQPDTYYRDLTKSDYFDALIMVRHYLKAASDAYFSAMGAYNIDLFMFTPSISSPMGPGSDSEAVPIKFGELHTYLVDSSQFGFEPLLFRNFDKFYCYLPSMRGENPDARHLNQFFHCEAEIVGRLEDLYPVMEGYIKALARMMRALKPLVSRMSMVTEITNQVLDALVDATVFKNISFDEAYKTLAGLEGAVSYVTKDGHGRNITAEGEKHIAFLQDTKLPLWISNYDRDMVPFYQKPNPSNPNQAVNADLIFPSLTAGGFGGEIMGSGQRQNIPEEMEESLARQNVSQEPYAWYIDLRRQSGYRTTSGFGLGIERFIAWALGYSNIRDVILYPRLKNVQTLP